MLTLVLVAWLGLLAAEQAEAGARKARQYYEQARKAELAESYDKALELYELAVVEDPENPRYQLAVRRMRFVAGQSHVRNGQQLRQEGHLEQAVAEFERALEIDPASAVAAQERQRTLEMIEERNKKGQDAPPETASALEQERTERERRMATLKALPELQPISTQPINLMIPNQESKVVFETIGKLAGINPIFDPEYQDNKISIELQNATLYEALDYVALIAKAFWKPLSHNAIFITNDNTNKRRDYDDEVVRTFYLSNVSTPQELQEIATAIRGLTDLRRIFAVNAMNALVVRGPADKIALAEKVITDVDKARPEVIIDVLVLETSKSATRELGITPISGDTPGINVPVTFTGQGVGASGESRAIPLSEVGNVSSRDWSTVLPDGVIKALMSRSDTRLLQSPRVRAADNFQATLNIGSRIPIATGSFQPGIGGVGINPLVNTQFNYVDVGVNVALTPKIHSDREVSMHVEVEVSNVREFVDIGGISQPVFGQRKVAHDIRIQEGESSILGGLVETQSFLTRSGLPVLGDLPILGRLFSTQENQTTENEILIILLPHIVRLPEIKMANLKAVASGTDQVFRVRYEQEGNDKPALPPVGARALDEEPEEPVVAEAPAPAVPAPPTPEQPAAPAVEQPAAPAEPAQPQPAEPPAAAPTGPPVLSFGPAAPQVEVGQQVSVNVVIENVSQLFGVPLRFGYDPKILRLVEISRGPFLAGDGQDLIFSRNIRNEVGQAAVNISRFPGTGGVDGRGVLVTLVLEGVAPGSSNLRVTPTGARDAETRPVQVAPAQVSVTVR